jgi:hypothetical protein
MFGVFRVKNHDFTPKNLIFSNFRGGACRVRPPPLDPPLGLSGLLLLAVGSLVVFVLRKCILKLHILVSSEHKLCQT